MLLLYHVVNIILVYSNSNTYLHMVLPLPSCGLKTSVPSQKKTTVIYGKHGKEYVFFTDLASLTLSICHH